MPRVVVDPILLPDGEVADQIEGPIAAEMGETPVFPDLALVLDPYAPAPTFAPPNDQEGHSNGTN